MKAEKQTFGTMGSGHQVDQGEAPRPQHLIDKQYGLLEVIGQGTFGKVYKVLDLEHKKAYALKVVLQEKKYKNRELTLTLMVQHPNVVHLHDHYYTAKNGERFLNLVMEYMPLNLYQILRNAKKKKEPVGAVAVKLWAFQLLKALAYLEELRLSHRDLKPMNVLINPLTQELQVCDFGSAKVLVSGEANVCYICSRYYRAPELLFGLTDYSTEIDMWSCGCILAEMLTQDTVFCGESSLDQIIEIIKVIGTPDEKYLARSPSFKALKIPPMKTHPWKSVLKRFGPEPAFVDLITRILVFDREARLRPCQALLHPYFEDLITPQYEEAVAKIPHLFDFSKHQFAGHPEEGQRLREYFRRAPTSCVEFQEKLPKSVGSVETSCSVRQL